MTITNYRNATHFVVTAAGARIPVAALADTSGLLLRSAGLITAHIRQAPVPFRADHDGTVFQYTTQGFVVAPGLTLVRV